MTKIKLKIIGMHCSSCAKLIEAELIHVVNSIVVNYDGGIADIDFDEKKISEKELKEIIHKLGYKIK